MATHGRVLEVLRDYRNELEQQKQAEVHATFAASGAGMSAFSARGAMSAFATPLSNVHATGVGVRVRQGEVVPDEFVIKVFVFDKVAMDEVPALTQRFGEVEVDVEPLPIQHALQVPAVEPQQGRQRPVVGGLSISPLNE